MRKDAESNIRKLDEILKIIKRIEKRIDNLDKKIENFFSEALVSRSAHGGRFVQVDVTKREIYKLLKERKTPMTSQEVSEALGISRSYASALLNELFRDGVVNKIRERKTIKFAIPDEES